MNFDKDDLKQGDMYTASEKLMLRCFTDNMHATHFFMLIEGSNTSLALLQGISIPQPNYVVVPSGAGLMFLTDTEIGTSFSSIKFLFGDVVCYAQHNELFIAPMKDIEGE